MPRTRAQTSSTYSHGDADPELDLIHHQMRIVELRKERDERLHSIIQESDSALEELRAKITAHLEEHRKKSIKHQGENISMIIEKLDRRREIEEQMVQLVSNLHLEIKKMEEIMAVGYRGREEEARRLLEEVCGGACSPGGNQDEGSSDY